MSRAQAFHGAQSLRRGRLVLASALLAALSACGNGDPSPRGAEAAGSAPETAAPAPSTSDEGATGTLSFELRTVGGITLNTFDYAITGPHFLRSGSVDVSSSTTVSTRIDGIPAGAGYSVTLSANSVGTPKAQCSGSAGFDVQAGKVSRVPVAINCHVADTAVTPPDPGPAPAPLPPFVTWLSGLALLALGSKLAAERSRPKTLV
jgi:hypothetical protein